jgi:hypothetical protein
VNDRHRDVLIHLHSYFRAGLSYILFVDKIEGEKTIEIDQGQDLSVTDTSKGIDHGTGTTKTEI